MVTAMAKQTDERVVAFDDFGFSIRLAADASVSDAASAAGATIGWEPQIVLDGEVLPFSQDNALRLYQRVPAVLGKIVESGANV